MIKKYWKNIIVGLLILLILLSIRSHVMMSGVSNASIGDKIGYWEKDNYNGWQDGFTYNNKKYIGIWNLYCYDNRAEYSFNQDAWMDSYEQEHEVDFYLKQKDNTIDQIIKKVFPTWHNDLDWAFFIKDDNGNQQVYGCETYLFWPEKDEKVLKQYYGDISNYQDITLTTPDGKTEKVTPSMVKKILTYEVKDSPESIIDNDSYYTISAVSKDKIICWCLYYYEYKGHYYIAPANES